MTSKDLKTKVKEKHWEDFLKMKEEHQELVLRYFDEDYYNKYIHKDSHILGHAFQWSNTPQGVAGFNELYVFYENYEDSSLSEKDLIEIYHLRKYLRNKPKEYLDKLYE